MLFDFFPPKLLERENILVNEQIMINEFFHEESIKWN